MGKWATTLEPHINTLTLIAAAVGGPKTGWKRKPEARRAKKPKKETTNGQ